MIGQWLALPAGRYVRSKEIAGWPLIIAAALGLLWANLLGSSYTAVWETEATLSVGTLARSATVKEWISDLLLPLFFFIAGLELKRELTHGTLSRWKAASMPLLAALGGMVVPAGIFLAFKLLLGGGHWRGWGVPVATDIAFALAILQLLRERVPHALLVFVLAFASVDDMGGVLVIAFFYSHGLSWTPLLVAAAILLLTVFIRWLGVRLPHFYWMLGTLFVLALVPSGIHTTIGGLLLGLLTPADPTLGHEEFARRLEEQHRHFREAHQKAHPPGSRSEQDVGRVGSSEEEEHTEEDSIIARLDRLTTATDAPTERLVRQLNFWVSYGVLPLFALSHAGVELSGKALSQALSSPVSWGVLAGLVVGKPLGFVSFCWLGCKLGLAQLPEGVAWRHIIATGVIAGIGFTVSLFIAHLAFHDDSLRQAKTGVLVASVVAGCAGYVAMRLATRRQSRS